MGLLVSSSSNLRGLLDALDGSGGVDVLKVFSEIASGRDRPVRPSDVSLAGDRCGVLQLGEPPRDVVGRQGPAEMKTLCDVAAEVF